MAQNNFVTWCVLVGLVLKTQLQNIPEQWHKHIPELFLIQLLGSLYLTKGTLHLYQLNIPFIHYIYFSRMRPLVLKLPYIKVIFYERKGEQEKDKSSFTEHQWHSGPVEMGEDSGYCGAVHQRGADTFQELERGCPQELWKNHLQVLTTTPSQKNATHCMYLGKHRPHLPVEIGETSTDLQHLLNLRSKQTFAPCSKKTNILCNRC